MSRHRLVKNLNLADELDLDDALSDGGEEDLTPEQQAQMNDGLARVRSLIGSYSESGLEDKVIKDALWNEYFDVETAVEWLLEERGRRQLAAERKDKRKSKDLPPLPGGSESGSQDYEGYDDGYPDDDGFYGSPTFAQRDNMPHELDMEGRPRVPLIHLAQQGQMQGQMHPLPEPSDPGTYPTRYRLSTISEKTERTEASPHWPTKQQLYAHNNPQPSSPRSSYTSYGEIIDRGDQSIYGTEFDDKLLNPNNIPPSPSPSAQQRLSHYEPAPSVARSSSKNSATSSHVRTEAPPMEVILDIPDYRSKSTVRPPAPIQPSTTGNTKKSKLSMLASSRASTASKSSITYDESDTASVVTYPALRPSTESQRSLSSASSISSLSSASTVKARPRPPAAAVSPPASSTSSHVRRAIQTALELEAVDRYQTPPTDTRSISSLESGPLQSQANPLSPTDSHMKGRQSKLALLAQAKAAANLNAKASLPLGVPSPKPIRMPAKKLPESRTQYITPIANGPTATTAITTSYQSLYSLNSPASSLPALSSTPLESTPSRTDSTGQPKRSKLALKAKRAHEKPGTPPSPQPEEFEDFGFPEMTPIFKPKKDRRALPSAFASLLIDDGLIPSGFEDKAHRDRPKRNNDGRLTETTISSSSYSDLLEEPKRTKSSPDTSSQRFNFDIPSPDDVVLNARRGTSLAQRR